MRSSSGVGGIVKLVPDRWVPSASWATGIWRERPDGTRELIGLATAAGWERGVAGTCRLALDDGSVLSLERAPASTALPLAPAPLPMALRPTEEVEPLDVIDRLARDYLREIDTLVDGVSDWQDEEPTRDQRMPRRPGWRRGAL